MQDEGQPMPPSPKTPVMRALAISALLALPACAGAGAGSAPPAAPSPEPPAETPEKTGGADFSRPESAVATFIDACTAKDAELIAQCFSTHADGEFAALARGEAGEEDLEELKRMFEGASIVDTTMAQDESSAVVRVKLQWEGRNHEDLVLADEGGAWKIRSF
jgi:hypothetical protein